MKVKTSLVESLTEDDYGTFEPETGKATPAPGKYLLVLRRRTPSSQFMYSLINPHGGSGGSSASGSMSSVVHQAISRNKDLNVGDKVPVVNVVGGRVVSKFMATVPDADWRHSQTTMSRDEKMHLMGS